MVRTSRRVLGYLLITLGVGLLAGLLWWLVSDVPAYAVADDGSAATDERGLATFASADAWFTVLGVVAGPVLGVLAWRLLRHLGWPVVLIGVSAALAAALICWLVGYALGPGALPPRLAAAPPGAQVPVEFTLRAYAALAVWPFAAVLPILLAASLGDEPAET